MSTSFYRVQDGIVKNIRDTDEDTTLDVAEIDSAKPTKKQRATRVDTLLIAERGRAKSTLQRMRAHLSGWAMKVAAYILFKLLRVILRTVQVLPSQVEKLKRASKVRRYSNFHF